MVCPLLLLPIPRKAVLVNVSAVMTDQDIADTMCLMDETVRQVSKPRNPSQDGL
jgi:hypothetical protein